tara:strand:- start:3 stop:1052 length:1050 start_codon:yes stop_codon:yes gene_type:complete
MSGWGALASGNDQTKVADIVEEKTTAPVQETVPEQPVQEQAPPQQVTSTQFVSNFPDIEAEMVAQSDSPIISPSSIFCGVVGHEGTGKSGVVFDAHFNRYPDGLMMAVDFDNGALSCKQAHYRESNNVRIFSPWVMQMQDRTAYNYLLTFQRVMDIGRYAIEYAERQQQAGFDEPLLRTFFVTGVDQFDAMCIDCMKIYDLDMDAKDAIEASHSKLNQEVGWNWNIRATRFKQLTGICRKLNALGVDVYWESHLKEHKDSQPEFEGWKFAWHASANKDLWQIIWCKGKKVRNSDGSSTGEVQHTATFFKSKLNPNLHNQERIYFVTKVDEDAKWYGLPELRDGAIGGIQ